MSSLMNLPTINKIQSRVTHFAYACIIAVENTIINHTSNTCRNLFFVYILYLLQHLVLWSVWKKEKMFLFQLSVGYFSTLENLSFSSFIFQIIISTSSIIKWYEDFILSCLQSIKLRYQLRRHCSFLKPSTIIRQSAQKAILIWNFSTTNLILWTLGFFNQWIIFVTLYSYL